MSRAERALQALLGLAVGWVAGGVDGPLFVALVLVGFGLIYTAMFPHSKT